MNPPQIHAPKAISPALEMLRKFVQSRVAAGVEFKIGQSLQCSWMWFKVGTDERGQPTILAPQAGTMPMRFVTDSSDALNLVLTQRYVCDSFGVEWASCNAMQYGVVIKNLADCNKAFMVRTEHENGNASGWFFGSPDSKLDPHDGDNLEFKSLWELSCDFPNAKDFFLLPRGWQVALEDRPVVLKDFKVASARPGSYYVARYQS